MTELRYMSGEAIREGDVIRYHGETGSVEFVVGSGLRDGERDWFLEEFPAGGVMIQAEGFGRVFIKEPDDDEDLELVSRAS